MKVTLVTAFVVFMGCLPGALAASPRTNGIEQFLRADHTQSLMAQGSTHTSPCDDPQFVALKAKPIDEMSPREYEYFRQKERECDEYRRLLLEQSRSAEDPVSAARSSGTSTGIILGILGTCAFLILISAIAAAGS